MEGTLPGWNNSPQQVRENPFGLAGSVQAVTEALLAAAQTYDASTNTGGVRYRPTTRQPPKEVKKRKNVFLPPKIF